MCSLPLFSSIFLFGSVVCLQQSSQLPILPTSQLLSHPVKEASVKGGSNNGEFNSIFQREIERKRVLLGE